MATMTSWAISDKCLLWIVLKCEPITWLISPFLQGPVCGGSFLSLVLILQESCPEWANLVKVATRCPLVSCSGQPWADTDTLKHIEALSEHSWIRSSGLCTGHRLYGESSWRGWNCSGKRSVYCWHGRCSKSSNIAETSDRKKHHLSLHGLQIFKLQNGMISNLNTCIIIWCRSIKMLAKMLLE